MKIILCFVSLFCLSWTLENPEKHRVKRQIQSFLTVLNQNPALVQQIQQNPELMQLLQNQLGYAQPQPQTSLPSALSLIGNIPLISTSNDGGECSALKKQNKLLRQMLLSVAGEDHPELFASTSHNPRELLQAATSNSAQALLEKAVGGGAIQSADQFLTSVLVTPTPTWQTDEVTTTYVTTVTETASTQVPIILRGNKVITTILEEQTNVITKTDTMTSSSLVTPTPTWSTFVITQTPTVNLLSESFGTVDSDSNPSREDNHPRKRNNVVQAKVVEIEETTTPRGSKLDRFREAYGAYFASSAQRTAQRFGDSFKRVGPNGEDQMEEFDQQSEPAQNRPVYVPSPNPRSHKEFTLYFSGRSSGEVTTKTTILPVNGLGRPLRSKREAIHPTKVEPIEQTRLPEIFDDNFVEEDSAALQSSMEPCGREIILTVTVTKTVTKTVL